MKSQRARQIMASLGVIEVRYQGTPVWIEQVRKGEALVLNLESRQKKLVALSELEEC
ncbi:small, acid-soluble spore protein, H family [Syntrophomonas erecta]